MINIYVENDQVYMNFGGDTFDEVLLAVKGIGGARFMGKERGDWKIPLHKLDKLIDIVEEYDEVQIPYFHKEALEELKRGKPHLVLADRRRRFNVELLKHPPRPGKPPFENYQREDVSRAINRNRYGLFLDMGMGKAWMKAAIIAHLRHYGLAHKVLLLSTRIGSMNMVHEILKHIYIEESSIQAMFKAGEDRELFKPDKDIAITNYNTFRYVANYYYEKKHKFRKKAPADMRAPVIPIKEWLGDKPGILLLDESHLVGNSKSQITKRVMNHSPFFEYVYEFSGTPADKPEKLYTQLKMLDPWLVHNLSYYEWLDVYAHVGDNYSKYNIRGWKHEKLEKLNKIFTTNYGVYRDAEDCLDIPPNKKIPVYVTLESKHKAMYQSFVKETLFGIQEKHSHLSTQYVVNSFPYMMLALDNPKLLLPHEDILSDDLIKEVKKFKFKDHAKVDALHGILDEEEDKTTKGIIWIYHPSTARALEKELAKHKPLVIDGDTPEEERFEILERFNTNDENRILIASIEILNTSVTLTRAKFQVYFERVFKYSKYEQSTKRIHRIGQDVETRTYVLIFRGTLDMALDLNLKHKGMLNSKILSKGFMDKEQWSSIFSMEENSEEAWKAKIA